MRFVAQHIRKGSMLSRFRETGLACKLVHPKKKNVQIMATLMSSIFVPEAILGST